MPASKKIHNFSEFKPHSRYRDKVKRLQAIDESSQKPARNLPTINELIALSFHKIGKKISL